MNLQALHNIGEGLYIVTAEHDQRINGLVANALIQITADPLTIALGINKNNLTHRFIQESGQFSVSILEKNTPLSLLERFGIQSGRDIDKYDQFRYIRDKDDIPVLTQNTIAYLVCQVIRTFQDQQYTIFIGEVLNAEQLKSGQPLTYNYYRDELGGEVPPAATSYLKKDSKKAKRILRRRKL